MSKKDAVVSGIMSNISEEFLDKQVDKLISATKEMMENRNKINETKNLAEIELEKQKLQTKQNYCKEEKQMVQKEFNRICGMLSHTDPCTDKYHKLSESLYNLKKLLTGWNGYDFD